MTAPRDHPTIQQHSQVISNLGQRASGPFLQAPECLYVRSRTGTQVRSLGAS